MGASNVFSEESLRISSSPLRKAWSVPSKLSYDVSLALQVSPQSEKERIQLPFLLVVPEHCHSEPIHWLGLGKIRNGIQYSSFRIVVLVPTIPREEKPFAFRIRLSADRFKRNVVLWLLVLYGSHQISDAVSPKEIRYHLYAPTKIHKSCCRFDTNRSLLGCPRRGASHRNYRRTC